MTLAELIASFRVDADDQTAPYLWPDEEVRLWLNEAEDEACQRAKLIFDSSTAAVCQIAVTTAASVYALHAATLDIYRAALTDAAGDIFVLTPTDRIELDRVRPDWRTVTRRPTAFIQHDTNIELDAVVDATYTLNLEVCRLPLTTMDFSTDVPEINRMHHRHLVQWALHRAYSKPDSETLNLDKSARAEDAFTKVFGNRPGADMRKKQQANRPHRVKAVW